MHHCGNPIAAHHRNDDAKQKVDGARAFHHNYNLQGGQDTCKSLIHDTLPDQSPTPTRFRLSIDVVNFSQHKEVLGETREHSRDGTSEIEERNTPPSIAVAPTMA